MKSFIALSAALVMLLNVQETQAISLNQKFVDDIAKALAESEAREEEEEKKKHPAPAPAKPTEVKQ